MQILALSGSLRAVSSNTTLLRAAADIAPPGVVVRLYEGLGGLPPFNPDLDLPDSGDAALPAVADLRARVRAADGVLISSPEYAHGVPGVLKNALDWLVGSGEFVDKPVVLLNARPYATHAQASLTETLAMMTAHVVSGTWFDVPLAGKMLGVAGILANPDISGALRAAMAALTRDLERGRTDSPLISAAEAVSHKTHG